MATTIGPAATPAITATTDEFEGLTVAQAQIALAAMLAEICARRPRWPGAFGPGDPASCAFFLMSAASVDWVDAAVAHPDIRAIDVSLEGTGGFAAIESSIASGRLQTIICGSGPGTLGPLWTIPAAKGQGGSLLVLAPRTPPHLSGRTAIQEASCFDPLHMVGGELYDAVFPMSDAAEMPIIAMRLRHLFERPQGAVVQVSVPTNVLGDACPALPDVGAVELAQPAPSTRTIARVIQLLTADGGPPAFLLGSGCVAYRDEVAELVARFGAVHFSTPAAAGVLPNTLGSIGNAAGGGVPARLRELDVCCVVVLCSRLGIASGGGDAALLPTACPVVLVDLEPTAGAANAVATWGRPVLSITADIGEFLHALLCAAPAACRTASSDSLGER